MPISSVDQQRAWIQAQGMVQAARSNITGPSLRATAVIDPLPIARRLYGNNSTVPGATLQAYLAVARDVVRAEAAAQRMNRNVRARPQGADVPRDRLIQPGDAQYRYFVLVDTISADGLTVIRHTAEVASDDPLNRAELAAQVDARMNFVDSVERRTGRAVMRIGAGETVQLVAVLTVGRAP